MHPAPLHTWLGRAATRSDTTAVLELARDLGPLAPKPASGRTSALWEILATIAAADVEVARIVEPHLDALAILAEARAENIPLDLTLIGADESSTWGVFAAEASGMRLEATAGQGSWMLSGRKPWCSLASRLTHALVTAHTSAGRALFAVDLRSAGVHGNDELWVSRGMPGVPSAPVDFDGVRAIEVGRDGWYLQRPGFSWGGLGVAAVWWGGAIGIARAMFDAAGAREPDGFALAHLGAVDLAIEAARAELSHAAARIDSSGVESHADSEARLLAARGRAIAARCAETVLEHSVRSLGPAPLALDKGFARRHSDLAMYVRQHHAQRDDAALGKLLVSGSTRPW